jgi:WD40 repeat protein
LVNAVSFSPDHQSLATGSQHGTTIWRAEPNGSWTPLADVANSEVRRPCLTFTPDGKRLIGREGIFDAVTGSTLRAFGVFASGADISHSAMSPDGRVAAFADESAWNVRVVDVASVKIISPVMSHRDRVTSMSFSRDGELLATASEDNMARVFHARSGRLIASIEFTHGVQQATFSPDGRRLLVACDDGAATVWSLEPDRRPAADLLRLAELMAWSVIDEFDSVIEAKSDVLTAAWRALVRKHPGHFPKLGSMPTTRPVQ